ncbi:hydantoinase B/oxoprolinase family protein [Halopenitus persicus]|uniref:N-methylhydantoinase B n=1 Tax=Halopenitus persicus TaxID=1048396 RepID=A0A1H3L2W6_9EURY|nr:hydantoinase B/oxoprolinase family protein [Halopenitus persicus]QHS18090.1 hydantoinase B/oxoprolinase family protein [haloarchaeon 3A1-DGR]SDY58700.1 N-methylhydantoinase B [Halopenitus persicus]
MVSPGKLEIFRHSLKGIVEEMGVTLQRTAYSTNIKIRRDHTCALFDSELRHIAQHDIAPQHIGSLVSVVPRNMRDRDDLEPGDGILINDPYKGAVHLPDVMLICPLFHDGEIIGYAANSAHHVDIGGPTPGGIPTDSTDLYGEGVIMPGVRAVEDWEYDEEMLGLITRNVRSPEMRVGDYRAQLGANRIGEERFGELYEEYGADALTEYLDELIDYTERLVRSNIQELPDGVYDASDYMDGDGINDEELLVTLTIEIDDDEMTLDFTGTAAENEGPLNCTPAMAFAGTMAVVMSLLGGDLPKNEGFYRPFEIITPKGSMVNPTDDRPVAAGWEIAIRAGDLVTKAMADVLPEETIAATKGIICNIAYGGRDPRSDDDEYVYYETVGGGYGGRATKDGMDGVQAHYQNTANSPIEELETEIPLYVRRYEYIQDSEGAGRQRGGLGIRRDMEFYDHRSSFTVLSDRTKNQPWGLFGGHAARAANYVINPDDDPEVVSSKSTTKLDPNDVASVQTPGGGGYGDPLERPPEDVLEDVVNEKVSVEKAESEYGVAVDLEDRSVDEAATRELREEVDR